MYVIVLVHEIQSLVKRRTIERRLLALARLCHVAVCIRLRARQCCGRRLSTQDSRVHSLRKAHFNDYDLVNMEDIGTQVPALGGLKFCMTHVKPLPLASRTHTLKFQADLKQNPGNW